MFDHMSIGVKDLARSRGFYDSALGALGYERLSNWDNIMAMARKGLVLGRRGRASGAADRQSGLHFCFIAPTKAAVDAFYAAVLPTAEKITAPQAFARNMANSTTPPSSSTLTATGWKRSSPGGVRVAACCDRKFAIGSSAARSWATPRIPVTLKQTSVKPHHL